jgi:hypothetical protein
MKTKDLIKELQEADPSGESQVEIGNGGALYGVQRLPGYYDGWGEYIVRDENGEKYFLDYKNDKVRLYWWDLKEYIFDRLDNHDEVNKAKIETIAPDGDVGRKETLDKVVADARQWAKDVASGKIVE